MDSTFGVVAAFSVFYFGLAAFLSLALGTVSDSRSFESSSFFPDWLEGHSDSRGSKQRFFLSSLQPSTQIYEMNTANIFGNLQIVPLAYAFVPGQFCLFVEDLTLVDLIIIAAIGM